ncbi:2-amino-4-hydroxy-6-hydroxymethyldihydropteridine diphosphokinase [Kordiimonas aquimaris]|uniref:2-amino-4-hydroxy-6- hydroxymethyldihydropteridine diphosphokinase n=1 Tax=Kordiimonas aquimaris TaxID=707591 RepID=UPI0021D09725|nr:2-amino-4-hydroxy-6-hydroxymethyldihydropteridine diphosphokinase [Kordiimonas aquimaris]
MKSKQGIFLGIGSNLSFGLLQPYEVLQHAVQLMPQFGLDVENASSIYETPPYPDAQQPNFANAVVEVKTHHQPHDVLQACLDIEERFNRERRERWGARTLDIDVLAYNEIILPDMKSWSNFAQLDDVVINDLVLPHPRLHKRMFVLVPFQEIAPYWTHPVLHHSVVEFCSQTQVTGNDGGIKKLSSKLL